ncbi:MAG: OsmC family protein [Chloroflexi bacterium]|nr:OsmC family protein [Chloroflexota bacterium]
MAVLPTETSLTWTGGTLFETTSPGGDILQLDMPLAKGGSGHGFSPMTLLLQALAGCMAVTVVQILEKQRSGLTAYRIAIRGERSQVAPSPYTSIEMTHTVQGEKLDRESVERIVELVEEKYCSVAATLPRGLVHHRVVVEQPAAEAVVAAD